MARPKGYGGRSLSYENLMRMTDQEVADYWASGVLPGHLDIPIILPTAQGRSVLEVAERKWARGEE